MMSRQSEPHGCAGATHTNDHSIDQSIKNRALSTSSFDTDTETSRVSIAPCPIRLTPLIPPANYGSVQHGAVFRSGFPQAQHTDFLESLHIRSILTLVDTELSEPYTRFISEFGIDHTRVLIAANKDGQVRATDDSICAALAFVLNPDNQPLYIHCNQGRHRTGCVVGCLRKLQQWPLDEILAEYRTYASPKTRSADIELITKFEPDSLVRWAGDHGADSLQWLRGSITDVDDVYQLAEAVLPAHNLAQLYRRTSHETFDDSEDEFAEDEEEWQSTDSSQTGDTGAVPLLNRGELGSREHGTTVIDYGLHQSSNTPNVTAIATIIPFNETVIDNVASSASSTPSKGEDPTATTTVLNVNSSHLDYNLRGRTLQPRPTMLDRPIPPSVTSTVHV